MIDRQPATMPMTIGTQISQYGNRVKTPSACMATSSARWLDSQATNHLPEP